ncbi:Uncharacterized 2Fe-2 and 4Fe-4S clusters-containing protein, contains DUF4445 domain [Rhodoblastus acidophilus]|uniref:Uncharacterized 2Fe-2 and 4Fe-4S clusters-containing protein, contains DUF4445 domain n=1 Tax=Rhodoblastus acidophilus TaxID=1074 RepID=A0A212PYP7_RHOAC|nr:ASKHA domain-containing protein [Rhodoblastus acidophilus]PPQ38705.1 hypothetical protein CKO16_08805 [Rhodoblastus acidophilus]RAI21160.1 hypothetical protein CH337_07985 [Rhodoblastus acidophilus]SNB52231.1 Uncharacterized 2Fe-2 and 4Fe-4S clusters-containing protein, contains DUF4445 domain [Rhodoblastus acidophilus]
MAQVHFRSHDISVEVEQGASLLDAARRGRIRLDAPCNGAGTCGKCKVRLDDAARDAAHVVDSAKLSEAERREGFVLLCTTLVDGDLALDLPVGAEHGLKILEDGQQIDLPLSPWIAKRHSPERDVTELLAGGQAIAEERGDTTPYTYGLAVDIGSTTLVAALIDLNTGARVNSGSALNPQARYAQDVLSRIKLGSTAEGLELLSREVISEINRLIGALVDEARIPRRRIYEAVFAGNTCMLHLAARVDPEPLGRYPYTPTLTGDAHLSAKSLGLAIAKTGLVYVPPVVSGFVGADITAGMLSTSLADLQGVTLFVDIGTNGEMALARDGLLQATSTAAGPAFEGMNISCGMRAARGAIERVSLTGGDVHVQTIGDAPPVGLCGSGLLDAVAELAVHGVVETSGRFTKNRAALPSALQARFAKRDGKPAFHLTDEIYLSQGDIRQVQLAKGAVRAGIDVLLRRNGLDAAQVDRALIAGSFGYHLTVRSLIDIGLFPPEFDGKVTYVGNSSQTGAEALLTHAPSRARLAELARAVEAVELANDEAFTKIFVAAMAFPRPERAALDDVA